MPAADFSPATRQTALRGWARLLMLALAAAAMSMGGSPTLAAGKPKPASPPSQELASAPLPAGADKAKLDAAFAIAQTDLGANQALVVLQNGAVVLERYAQGYEQGTRLNSWNVGSAITSALVGRAVKTGAIKSLDEPAGLTEWKIAADGRQNITIRNLLAMNSGLGWKERAAGSESGSDADKMLFGEGQLDVLAYAAAKKSTAKPGERFVYSTGSSVLLAAALQRRLPPLTASDGKRTYALQKFMNAELFDKLGMTQTAPQFDISGNFEASLIWMSARDLAKFGEFCLRDGVWNKERLLPEGWIQTMRTPSGAKDGDSYGAGFWIKAKSNPDSLMANLPDDSFAAGGDRGQVVVMIPSKDLVIVRLGLTPRGEKSRAALGVWLGQVASAFPDVKK